MKIRLKLIGLALFVTTTISLAAPNPASTDWVKNYVLTILNAAAGPGITIENNVISTVQANSYIAVQENDTYCYLGGSSSPQCVRNTLHPMIFQNQTVASASVATTPIYDATTGVFTITATGTYDVSYKTSSVFCHSNTSVQNDYLNLQTYITVNNVQYAGSNLNLSYFGQPISSNGTIAGRQLINLNKNDQLTVKWEIFSNVNNGGVFCLSTFLSGSSPCACIGNNAPTAEAQIIRIA